MYFSEETYYYMLALLTTIAFIYSLYLIFYVSTPQMKPYVYLLLNIQTAAYLEVMFGALMCPVWMSPHLGLKADGTDPERDLGENFALIGGPTAKLYILVKNLLTSYAFVGCMMLASKSFNGTVSMIVSTTCYR
ncbi:hypothetical protein GCK32_013365 [Trichostrongylus colubriformis]|uniref:Uncharacterized protein n=1 Tax=Trichostrongylus colubriformis TaxID=6319 RepID=A0AAN8ISI4_TRICO